MYPTAYRDASGSFYVSGPDGVSGRVGKLLCIGTRHVSDASGRFQDVSGCVWKVPILLPTGCM